MNWQLSLQLVRRPRAVDDLLTGLTIHRARVKDIDSYMGTGDRNVEWIVVTLRSPVPVDSYSSFIKTTCSHGFTSIKYKVERDERYLPYIELGHWLCSHFQLETQLNFYKPITQKLQPREITFTSLDSLGSFESIYILQTQKNYRNMN